MTAKSTSGFALDKRNGKLMGVCSGFANWTGWNPMLVRLGVVAATIFVLGPVAILAYFLIGWAAS
ncbi:MAG: PspC domain-containing protein [Sphingomonadaceae bacterium]|nr:PspC domain-containing protein [Sphingomonadaceae bacterium]